MPYDAFTSDTKGRNKDVSNMAAKHITVTLYIAVVTIKKKCRYGIVCDGFAT